MADAEIPVGRTISKRAAAINHGTVGGYRKGCRCRKCTRAKSEQRAQERARKRARDAAASATVEPVVEVAPPVEPEAPEVVTPEVDGEAPAGPGPVESAVIDEIKLHDGAQGVAALAAVAVALAQEIDQAAGTSVAGAARQLVATLSEIRRLSAKTDEELAKLLAAMGRA